MVSEEKFANPFINTVSVFEVCKINALIVLGILAYTTEVQAHAIILIKAKTKNVNGVRFPDGLLRPSEGFFVFSLPSAMT